MKKIYKKLLFFIYAILIFFVPLVFTPFTKEVFEFPKMTFVYVLGIASITVYLINRVLSKKKKRIKFFWYIIPFVFVYIISTILSTDIYTSLWGYYSRFLGGLISILIFISLAYIAVNTFDREDYYRFFFLSLISLTLVSMFGVFQYYGEDLSRTYSTLGQPNWLAQYLGMFLPLLIILYSKVKGFNKYLLLFIYIIAFYCFWLTFSISGVLALIISLFFLPKINLRGASVLLVISLFVIFTNLGFFKSRINDVFIDVKKFISAGFIVYADDYLVSDPGYIRKGLWEGSLKLITRDTKTFLLGTGPQTFVYEFQEYRPQYLNYSSEWNYVLNRPHNYYLELFVELGLLGLLSYLYLIYITFVKSPKYLKSTLIVFYVTNLFGWPVVSTSLLFWVLFSYIK